ncbi:hypothetical protein CL658_04010 [bacterium]|nr:hypothetical protein [bacterium]|tara:strand:+ start:229 stop:648 length:420 start_codon:yes stop_codon:yes gene_type:complete
MAKTVEYSQLKIICYDGICNFCNRWIFLLLKLDKKNRFKYLWLQSETAKALLRKHQFDTTKLSTIVYLNKGKLYTKSTAVIKILSDLKGFWVLSKILLLIPTIIRDTLYIIIARYRYQLFGKKSSCKRPDVNHENQFIS